jgi:lysophospholipid acyltransferase
MIFALHLLMYNLVKTNPRICGKRVTILSLILLSLYHIYRMKVDYGGWTMDISTIMMCNVNKYSFFAYSCQDGRTDPSKLTKEQLK